MKEIFTPVCSKFSYSCCTLLFFAFSFFTPGLQAADPGKVNDRVIHVNGIEKEFTSLQAGVRSNPKSQAGYHKILFFETNDRPCENRNAQIIDITWPTLKPWSKFDLI